jgi:hypothetical protein
MSEFFSSGRVVDLILAVLLLEVVALTAWRRHGSIRTSLAKLVVAALPGVFLLLALRAALNGAGWMWMALWLFASFPAHIADIWRRRP